MQRAQLRDEAIELSQTRKQLQRTIAIEDQVDSHNALWSRARV